MSEIRNLGYVVLDVSDLPRWREFATVLGLQVGRQEGDRLLTLRMDNYEQRVVLEKGNKDELVAAGWELDSEEELDSYAEEVADLGIVVEKCSAEQAAERRVQKLYTCADPLGYRHEFYFGPSIEVAPFKSPSLAGPGFNTGPLGLGHLLVRSSDQEKSLDFCRRVLRLRLSDRIREEIAPGVVVDATFFHTRTGRHHSLAVARFPGAKKLGHVMIEVQSMDDVGSAYDRCLQSGYTINAELGRHPNDRMFSFYVATPSGFSLEYGWGGIVIDDSNWQVKTHDRLSEWGHRRKPPTPPSR
jgi:2,3-dihydroxybiphenyl 1,2-dioxygenase